MTNIRRYYIPEQLYFITNVIFRRAPVLVDNIDIFWRAFETSQAKCSGDLNAWVILPDHFHIIVEPGTCNISNFIHCLKLSFSRNYGIRHHCGGTIWQRRFWDHIIRDEKDYYLHLNYIHYNPVKHGYVKSPFDWPHSSIHKYREFYPDDWGLKDEDIKEDNFGE